MDSWPESGNDQTKSDSPSSSDML